MYSFLSQFLSAAISEFSSDGEGVTSGITDALAKAKEVSNMLDKISGKFYALLPSIIFALAVLILGGLFVKAVTKILNRVLKKASIDPTAIGFIKGLTKVVLNVFVYIICLSILRVPMTSIITIIGAAGLAVGLALQSSLSNLAGGFILLFEKPFKSGDYIEVAGVGGSVKTIGILYTRIVTPDNKEVYIPNGSISTSAITNASKNEKRRVDIELAISADADYVAAQKAAYRVVESNPKIFKDDDITIRIARHEDNRRILAVRVWTANSDYWNVYFDIQENIIKAFEDFGVVAPYNKITVIEV